MARPRQPASMDGAPWMTIAMLVIALIVVGVGGVSVLTNHLSYELYLKTLKDFALGVGLLGVGRGLAARKPN